MNTENQETETTPATKALPSSSGSRLQVGCKIVRGGHMIEVVDVTNNIVRYEKTMETSSGMYETETIEEDFDTFDEQVTFTIFHGAKFIPANIND